MVPLSAMGIDAYPSASEDAHAAAKEREEACNTVAHTFAVIRTPLSIVSLPQVPPPH
jgi:hypothetical protein